uniref:(northern house mosquito) hypothetical protein n=1 Tax=Culex pipiens TaxID=7175 RepID=A0A8D8AX47_CULPI
MMFAGCFFKSGRILPQFSGISSPVKISSGDKCRSRSSRVPKFFKFRDGHFDGSCPARDADRGQLDPDREPCRADHPGRAGQGRSGNRGEGRQGRPADGGGPVGAALHRGLAGEAVPERDHNWGGGSL